MITRNPELNWHPFYLRTLLAFVMFCGLPCSWVAVKMQEARRQQEAVVAIQGTGGSVRYKHEMDASGALIPVGGEVWDAPIDEWGDPIPGAGACGAKAPVPAWLRRLAGDDFFRTAVWASVGSDDGLKQVSALSALKRLTIDPNCRIRRRDPDVRLAIQAGLHDTRCFYLADNSLITDVGLQCIEGLTQLEELEILFPMQITEAGMDHLGKLKQLKTLRWWQGISDERVKRLQQALPGCKIECVVPWPA